MSFAIVADFPLGAYRGSIGAGVLDRWPSVARLHAALLAAAGQGVRAVERSGALAPCDDDHAALLWLESHPPDGLVLPMSRAVQPEAISYRDLGLLGPRARGTKRKVRRDHGSVRLAGELMWVWETAPPAAVAESLHALCADVPYLGQALSPVRLRTEFGDHQPSHRRARLAVSSGHRTDIELTTPRQGRTAALMQAHTRLNSAAAPAVRHDGATGDETEQSHTAPSINTRERYTPVIAPRIEGAPWSTVYVLPCVDRQSGPIPAADRLGWCVALHRALISLHGDDAPAILTGRYDPATSPPANRVALHVVDRHPAMTSPLPTRQAFVVAVPHDAAPEDAAIVAKVVSRLREVRRGRHGLIRVLRQDDAPLEVDGATFWQEGHDSWHLATPAIPDASLRRDERWTLDRAVALSIGLLLRDQAMRGVPDGAPRADRLRALADWAQEHELNVLATHRLPTSDVHRYVHRITPGSVVEPYLAQLSFGSIPVPDGCWMAIGQSRHLGGGLLVPDLPGVTGRESAW